MKANITFDLNDVDDASQFKLHSEVDELAGFHFEMKHNFMRRFKHLEDKSITYELILDELNVLLDEYNIKHNE